RQVYRPRSTATTIPSAASTCSGRSRERGREPRGFARTRTSSSSKSRPLLTTRRPPSPLSASWSSARSSSQLPIPGGPPPSPLILRSGEQRGPPAGEVGQRLAGRRHVLHLDARHDEAEHRGGGGQPVVVVRRELAAVQRPRLDQQLVLALDHLAAEVVELLGQRRDPVG